MSSNDRKGRTMGRMLAAACCALWLAAAGNSSAESAPRTYAVLSMVGGTIDVVTYQMGTGSHLDRNTHEPIQVTGGVFDKAALLAVDGALKRSDAAARVNLFAPSNPALFDHQERFFDRGKVTLPRELDGAVRGDGATHLVLITRYRGEAQLETRDRKLGSGMLEGLGFYIDPYKRMKRSDTGEGSTGFLAPFVYLRVSLVDLTTSMVMREQAITATTTLSAARVREGFDPWDALGPEEKIATLRRMLERELARVVPQLTGPS